MAENDSTSSAVDRLTYLLIGAGIGATVALLFAPKSGRELRGDIADASRKGLDYTTENARRLQQRAGELVDTTTTKAQDIYAQTASRAQDLIAAGKETVGNGQRRCPAACRAWAASDWVWFGPDGRKSPPFGC